MGQYLIVGGGSAGCVLAERLSADPRNEVTLLEAGTNGKAVWYWVPKGFKKALVDPSLAWHHPAQGDETNADRAAIWHRGKALGGSSAINGMVYMRGQAQDYEDWAAVAGKEWAWNEMGRVFRSMESHSLGADDVRGGSGPLKVSAHPDHDPICDAMIAAGGRLGLPMRDDINRPDNEGIAYVTRTISGGVRSSSARAFIFPNRHRRNLRIVTGARSDRVLFEGRRAVGVVATVNGKSQEFRVNGEIILCAGAIGTPRILELSGIGQAERLKSLGIEPLTDSPGVGENMREHYLLMMNFRLKGKPGLNREFRGARLGQHILRWALTRKGPLGNGSHDVCAFIRTRPELTRPDVELLMAPWTLDPRGGFETQPGMHIFPYILRPETAGRLHVTSVDPAAPVLIQPRYLATEADRRCAVDAARFIRRIVATEPLANFVEGETRPGPQYQSDDEIIEAYRRLGQIGHHAAGTARMGSVDDHEAVLDGRLRVKGVAGLRVADISIMPQLTSGNTNGPAMAIGWRASELILEDAARRND